MRPHPHSPSVTVLLFAAAREVVGASELCLPAADVTTADDVLQALFARHPALRAHARALRVAINGEYAKPGDAVKAGDEVAVIPPVAGGA